MNKITIAAAAGAATVMLTGCGPDLAQIQYGEKEEGWQQVIRENYSGYEAPRTAPPAIADSVSPRLLEEERLRQGEKADAPAMTDGTSAPAAASDDPEVMVDRAAEKPDPAAKEETAPAKKEEAPAKSDAAPAKAEKAPAAADKNAAQSAVAGDEYIVKSGDTLGKIAQQFYGDARRSDLILRANPVLAGNPDVLRIGMKLVIPKI